MTTRGPNWSRAEDEALAKAWVEVSEDEIVGNDQGGDDFWSKIHQIFATKGFGLERSILGLQTHYRTMNTQCHLWNACLRRAHATPISGSNQNDVVSQIIFSYDLYFIFCQAY
ncbi:hypothetical protein LINPERHAP2_LOCUS2500 [Linum perenne]